MEAETERVVARRGDLVIAETRHGFVCANAGVDASNLDTGTLALLPLDPDATAERIRHGLGETLGARLGVVITDTFGRAWRTGVVNVAIGCAGVPATVDLRGRPDDRGRPLEATVVALADEIAAASGLVMGKDARVPVALVRGVRPPRRDRRPGHRSDPAGRRGSVPNLDPRSDPLLVDRRRGVRLGPDRARAPDRGHRRLCDPMAPRRPPARLHRGRGPR